MTIQAVFFDLDGVLVDLCEVHYQALNKALGFEISRHEHETIYNGLSTHKKLEKLSNEGKINPIDIQKIWGLKQKYTTEHLNTIRYDKDKDQLLDILVENNIKVVCVTNAIRKTAEESLTRTGLIHHIEFIISNEDCERNKPHPDPYLLALKKLNLTGEEIIIVEDSPCGIKAASKVTTNVLEIKDIKDVNPFNVIKYIGKLEFIDALDYRD